MAAKMNLYSPNMVILYVFLCMVLSVSFGAGAQDFDVNSLLLKVNLQQGGSVVKTIGISSISGGDFSLEVLGVRGVSFNENSFVLQKGENKAMEILFNASGIKPGVYGGSIKISDGREVFYLPIIFEIQSRDVLFGANLDIPPKYTDLVPGEKLIAQVKIFDLTAAGGTARGLGPTRVNVDYLVYRVDGSLISSESESLVVDEQVQITKTLSLPESIQEGDYIFGVSVSYKSSLGTSSRIFSIVPVQESPPFAFERLSNIWIVAFFAFFFLGIIVIFVYFLKDRDRLVLDLKQYNMWELEKQKELLNAQRALLQKRGAASHLKVRKEVLNKVRALKAKHKRRIEEFSKLKKKGDTASMEKRLAEWKGKGYNTLMLESKMNSLTKKEMQKLLREWKRKYSSSKGTHTEGYKNT